VRRLLYVPIIHSDTDMGSAGNALAHQMRQLLGESRWELHQKTIEGFWQSEEEYLLSLDAHKLRIYQDGLAAEGEVGRRIIQEAAARGSRNYQLVLGLLSRGARFSMTEDASLLLKERENITSLLQRPQSQAIPYPQLRDQITAERDRFIAQRINATLQEGEIGLLFIGAYHQVASHLPTDIQTESIKVPKRVRDYFTELLSGRDEDKLTELAQHLIAPIAGSSSHY